MGATKRKSDAEIRKLIGHLKEAGKKYRQENLTSIEFCMTCGKVSGVSLPTLNHSKNEKESETHQDHFIIFTDYDHDGIGSTLNALKLVLGEEV